MLAVTIHVECPGKPQLRGPLPTGNQRCALSEGFAKSNHLRAGSKRLSPGRITRTIIDNDDGGQVNPGIDNHLANSASLVATGNHNGAPRSPKRVKWGWLSNQLTCRLLGLARRRKRKAQQ